ncbi:hypothetical protein HHK36_009548 [Tetracentron sinense]|uniref:Uncharacterized protein n=1 Tax=Tetracentron sinense TaxID=13715 RepID=A0A834ZD14_TETSI|nr:hypothetical protein HHK36_009548 [Tetracentron sinense]
MYMNPNPAASSPGWWSDFNKKGNSKKVGVFNQGCLSLQSNYRGYRVHDDDQDDGGTEEEKEMVMGLVLSQSQRSCLDLMQNCDLPPPLKVFAGADKTAGATMKPTTSTQIGGGKEDGEVPIAGISMGDDKMGGLLKALQLSQTRAREAERKAKLMTQERDRLSNSLLEESLKLFAHRQWVKLLELQVSQLQSQMQQKREKGSPSPQAQAQAQAQEEKKDDGGDVGSLAWCMALALCLGFALGCRYHVFNFLSFYPF